MAVLVQTGGKIKLPTPEYEQLINYTMLYDGGDAINIESELHWRSYNQTLGYSTSFSPLKISFKYLGEVGYVSTGTYDLTDYVSAHLRITELNCNSVYGSNGQSALFGLLGYLDKQVVDGRSANRYNFNTYSGGDQTNCYVTKSGTKSFKAELDLSGVTGSKYLAISAYCSQNAMSTVGYVKFKYGVFVKADDFTSLCDKAGVTAPTAVEELVADSESLTSILSNKDAVNFMVAQCTGNFMMNAVESETFITALNSSPYKSIVQANEHWAKFLAMVA